MIQTPPVCPKGHGPMMLVDIQQGERSLGHLWFCVNNDPGAPDYCDECEDYIDESASALERWQQIDADGYKTMNSPEFAEGQAAWAAGVAASRNPYKGKDEDKSTAWLFGWNNSACDALIDKFSKSEPKQLGFFEVKP